LAEVWIFQQAQLLIGQFCSTNSNYKLKIQ
jgi:hypothetical protein